MAARGVPMRTLQEMGHRDFKTTLIYADYAPGADERRYADAAFGTGTSLPSREALDQSPAGDPSPS